MEDEKFIESVRKYELIYNLKHPKYMDSIKKDLVWKEIGEQLKQPAAACKQRWQSLRDAYRRALNKKKGKSGQAAKNIKQWKYENEMAFVAPFFMERKTQDSLELTSDEELFDNAEDHLIRVHVNTLEKPNTDTEIVGTPAVANSDANGTKTSDELRQNEPQQNTFIKKSKASKRKAVEPQMSASAILMSKLLDDQNKSQPSREHDELDRFFLNISDTVKKFSPYIQALAKNKIFSLVSEMELQQLAPPNSTRYSFIPSPQMGSVASPENWNDQNCSAATPMPISPENWNDQTSQANSNWNDETDNAMQ